MRIIGIAVFCVINLCAFAQQDPEAKKILDRISEKTKNYQTIQADFELVIENKPDQNISSNTGKVYIKGNKYKLESMDTKVYYNGKTMWSYMEDINEVTITEPDPNDQDLIDNPSKIFTFYNRDFKYRLVGEVKVKEGWMYEIDLFPKNLDQPYSRFKILVYKEKDEIFMVSAIGKEGINYTAYIKNAKFNQPLTEDFFQFNPAKYKGIEIVDLR